MKHISKLLPAMVAGIMVFASCSKSDDTPSNPGTGNNNPGKTPTKSELISAKPWKLSAATVSPAMQGMTDMYGMMDACEKDDTYKFNNDATKTLTIDNGKTKCQMGDQQVTNSTWSFKTNETELVMGSTTYKLTGLTTSELKMTHTMDYMGTTYTISCTYSAQ